MYKPQLKPKPVPAIPPTKLNRPFIRFMRLFARPIQRLFGFKKISVLHPERLVNLYRDFQDKKIKLLFGFRHPYGNDPQLMVFLLHCTLPKLAKKLKVKLNGFPHAHFIYGAEVPLWSGLLVRKLLPHVGGLPVNHVKPDAKGINAIRKTLADGAYPSAIAPEGHVNYDSLNAAPLETGTARFCFWAAEDVARAGEDADIVLLPVSSHYFYSKNRDDKTLVKKILKILRKLEKKCGICGIPPSEPTGTGKAENGPHSENDGREILRERLSRLETRIREIYTESLAGVRAANAADVKTPDELAAGVIARAEGILGIPAPDANDPERLRARIYAARGKAWDRLLSREFKTLPPLARSLEARKAGEAWYAMRHIETAELLLHITPAAIPLDAPVSVFIEKTENMADLLERAKGGTLKNRPRFFPAYPLVIMGEPISTRNYLPLYKKDKKQAVEMLTEKTAERFASLAGEFLDFARTGTPPAKNESPAAPFRDPR